MGFKKAPLSRIELFSYIATKGRVKSLNDIIDNELVNRDVVRLTTHNLNLARNQQVVASWE